LLPPDWPLRVLGLTRRGRTRSVPIGGEGGIRTHEAVANPPVFKSYDAPLASYTNLTNVATWRTAPNHAKTRETSAFAPSVTAGVTDSADPNRRAPPSGRGSAARSRRGPRARLGAARARGARSRAGTRALGRIEAQDRQPCRARPSNAPSHTLRRYRTTSFARMSTVCRRAAPPHSSCTAAEQHPSSLDWAIARRLVRKRPIPAT
jgi:hypothetical protein